MIGSTTHLIRRTKPSRLERKLGRDHARGRDDGPVVTTIAFDEEVKMKRFAPMCLLAALAVLAAACSSEPVKKATKEKLTVMVISNTASDYWKLVKKGCEKADAELADVEVNFQMTYGGTLKEQERFINEALQKGWDAIAISPVDPAGAVKTINQAAKRIPVITQDSDAPDSERMVYLGADNKAAGRQAGELMKKALPQGGSIMAFVGKKDQQNSKERYEGLKEALQGSKVEVLDLIEDKNDHVLARDNATETMKKHPDIAGMVGLWSYNGPAILDAVRNAGKIGKVKIVAFDEETPTLDGIKDGSIFGSVAQQPFEYGYQSVLVMAKLARDDRSVIPPNKMIVIPPVVVQRGNVDSFRNNLNQMLGSK
jgi:ribose transport system substrate-binding protein